MLFVHGDSTILATAEYGAFIFSGEANYPYEEPTTLKSEYFTGRAYVWFDFILPLFALLFLSPKDGPPEVYG